MCDSHVGPTSGQLAVRMFSHRLQFDSFGEGEPPPQLELSDGGCLAQASDPACAAWQHAWLALEVVQGVACGLLCGLTLWLLRLWPRVLRSLDVVHRQRRDEGGEERWTGSERTMLTGSSSVAATGLFAFIGHAEHAVRAKMARGVDAIREEVEEHGTDTDKRAPLPAPHGPGLRAMPDGRLRRAAELVRYILDEEAGSNHQQWQHGWRLDNDPTGFFKRRGMRFDDFVRHDRSRMYDSWLKMASTLSDDTDPSASLDHLEAQAASTHPKAPPEHLGSLRWPQEPATGRPKVEDPPLSTTRYDLEDAHVLALRLYTTDAFRRINTRRQRPP